MRIGEVEQETGLPRKTIRYYESKGLLSVERSENSYREYDSDMVKRLKTIAIYRRAGISIADIQLWTDGVITTQEMLKKRLHELKDSVDAAADQVKLCHNLLAGTDMEKMFCEVQDLSETEASDVNEKESNNIKEPSLLGIDIGTTTISAVILSITSYRLTSVYTIPSVADLPSKDRFTKTQDAVRIMERVKRLIDALLHRCPTIRAIGITGQMHGIVYTDENGILLSPLFTWEDNRAGAVYGGFEKSTCEWIHEAIGYQIPPGYGLATHIDLVRHGMVPKNASQIGTIMDYAVCELTGHTDPVCHISNAASLGFFKPGTGFNCAALERLGVQPSILPQTTSENRIVGNYRGIPVAVAIGDNQASFLGAVLHPERTALINFGTGSQITMLYDENHAFQPTAEIEMRPYLQDRYLLSGSALCGGRAYALLESFFRTYAAACGLPETEQYETMNKLAWESIAKDEHLYVRTTFCGIRSDHTVRGAVTGIGEDNLTPGGLIAGVLYGMAEELYEMYRKMGGAKELVVSGNAARKNPALRQVLNRVFGMQIAIPVHMEEAAYGSALFAWKTIEPYADLSDFYTYTTEKEEK